MTNLNKLFKRVDEAKAQAAANGEVLDPSGTYTFTNHEAAVISTALQSMGLLLSGDKTGIILAAIAFRGNEDEAAEILDRVSKDILVKQSPAYINKVVDEFVAERNATDPKLS
jgi:hypothetical protein